MSEIPLETIGELVARYGEKAPPKCRICGSAMALGDLGGGRAKWYCDGEQARWMGMEPGPEKRAREQHFSASETVIACGDHRVIELLDAYRKLTKRPTTTAINVLGEAAARLPEGWSIELEFSRDGTELTLRDENGEPVDVFADERCHFQEALDVAVKVAAKGGAE